MSVRDPQGGLLCDPTRIRMRLHALDVWVGDAAVLTDLAEVRGVLRAGAAHGRATVVEEAFHVFPNGAVTGVLVLAQSHLSIHTWPELALANVDLLSYGEVDGARALDVVARGLGAIRTRTITVPRSIA